MIDVKTKPLNENPGQVLELLNSNKRNLSTLIRQYGNIIELYLQMLGLDPCGKANSNEVVLPEIEQLLKEHNYQCEFKRDGIYSNNMPIFTRTKKLPIIEIEDGKNSTALNLNQNGNAEREIIKTKYIKDFSKLTQEEKALLSVDACRQIEEPQSPQDRELKKITIRTSSAEGVEFLKYIFEEYVDKEDNEKIFEINTAIAYNSAKPVIDCKVERTGTENLQEYQYYNYGDNKMPTKGEEAREDGENYNYERLSRNLQAYIEKYSNSRHPIFTQTDIHDWKGEFGEKVRECVLENLHLDGSRLAE